MLFSVEFSFGKVGWENRDFVNFWFASRFSFVRRFFSWLQKLFDFPFNSLCQSRNSRRGDALARDPVQWTDKRTRGNGTSCDSWKRWILRKPSLRCVSRLVHLCRIGWKCRQWWNYESIFKWEESYLEFSKNHRNIIDFCMILKYSDEEISTKT